MADFEVRMIVKPNLSEEDKLFIEEKIHLLMEELDMQVYEDGMTYGKKPPYKKLADIPAGFQFYIKLNKYRSYFSCLEYNSYLEHDIHFH